MPAPIKGKALAMMPALEFTTEDSVLHLLSKFS